MEQKPYRVKATVKDSLLDTDSAFRDCTKGKVYDGVLHPNLHDPEEDQEVVLVDDVGDYVYCTTKDLNITYIGEQLSKGEALK
ncbi:hypothetical protein VAG18_002849 [Escherichia coli]|nr:hypothetical protein [Escherichia coli]